MIVLLRRGVFRGKAKENTKMSEEEYKIIFSKNLKYYMELNGKGQIDIIRDLGFDKSAVSTWCNGTRLPRMDKIEALAKYFNIKRSDLIEDHHSSSVSGDPAAGKQRTLAPDESRLLDNYGKLNETGKEKAQEYVADLSEQEKYTKEDTIPSFSARDAG